MIDFCEMNNLFICNSGFKHPARHITTWHCKRTQNGITTNIYNQIGYVLCPIDRKHILQNARSYNGTLVDSDHRIVITEFELAFVKMYKPHKNESKKHLNSYQLNLDNQKRIEYHDKLEKRLQETENCAMNWNDIKINMIETAEEVVG